MEKYDSFVVGGGPAGITAAIYLKRSNFQNVLVFNNPEDLLSGNYVIENLYGFESIGLNDLRIKGLEQAKKLGIEIKEENVTHIDYNYETSEVKIVTNKGEYLGKSLIFATGRKRIAPKIEGLKDLEGKGVSYCATCDGFFYKNKDVCVIGNKDFALNEYNYLKNIVKNIVLLTNGGKPIDGVNSIDKKISKIVKEDKKIYVKFSDDSTLVVDGMFIAFGNASSSDFAKQIGISQDLQGNIIVNERCQTNIENIYAAGDCTGGILQIAKAEYEGMVAGMEVSKYLRRLKQI
jgi:thioredoxin reductase (NADPH)